MCLRLNVYKLRLNGHQIETPSGQGVGVGWDWGRMYRPRIFSVVYKKRYTEYYRSSKNLIGECPGGVSSKSEASWREGHWIESRTGSKENEDLSFAPITSQHAWCRNSICFIFIVIIYDCCCCCCCCILGGAVGVRGRQSEWKCESCKFDWHGRLMET